MSPPSGSPPGGGPGEDSYLVSVSDLVSALIFVFIIMLAVFAYQLAQETERRTQETERLTAAGETRRRMLEAIAGRLQEAGIRVEVVPDQGILRLSDNAITFPSGSDTPEAGHEVNVGHLARALAEVVPHYVSVGAAVGDGAAAARARRRAGIDDGRRPYCQAPADPSDYRHDPGAHPWLLETLLIEGHTDAVPVAPGNRFRDNLELSSMRAATVHAMLVACEAGLDRVLNTGRQPILSTSGYGARRPVTADADRTDDNRRIDLRFLLEPPPDALQPIADPAVRAGVRDRYRQGRP